VGVLLIVLSVSLFTLYSSDAYSQGQQQQALQAYWNARAGVEHFCDQRRLPEGSTYDFPGRGRCVVSTEGKDLIFEGQYGKQKRRIRLLERDPARKIEEPFS
jgi:hypothetical protein